MNGSKLVGACVLATAAFRADAQLAPAFPLPGISPMSRIEPPLATPPAPATGHTQPARDIAATTNAMVRAGDRAASPLSPVAPGTPDAEATRAHLQPHP